MTYKRAVAGMALVMILLTAVVISIRGLAEEPLSAARQRLEDLSAAEKQDLDDKREWFYGLPPGEQQRLRALHQDLSRAPDADRLRQTMRRYSDWLRTLPSGQRAELLSMPVESRLAQIKLLQQQQEEWRMRHYVARQLSDADLAAVIRWMEEFAAEHEQEILAKLPHIREQWQSIDPARRRQMLVFFATIPGRGREPLRPSEEDIQRLKGRLSAAAQQELAKAQREERLVGLAERWMQAAIFSRRAAPPPPVPPKDLQQFYTGLDARQRGYFESLPAERMEMELTRMYHYSRGPRFFDSERPGFPRPSGESYRSRRGRPGGEGPPGERPPGDRMPPGERPPGPPVQQRQQEPLDAGP